MSSVITRALDVQQQTMDALFDMLAQADLIVTEGALGRKSDKRAVAELMDLFTSPEFYALEEMLRCSAGVAAVARGFEPLITRKLKSLKVEAKPRRKAIPKSPPPVE